MKLVTFDQSGKAQLGALRSINGRDKVFNLNRLDSHLPKLRQR